VPILDLLQQRGLIQRTSDPGDRRRRAIALTPAGQAMLNQLRQAADAVEADMLKDLDDRQQATLHRLLLTLFEATIGQAPRDDRARARRRAGVRPPRVRRQRRRAGPVRAGTAARRLACRDRLRPVASGYRRRPGSDLRLLDRGRERACRRGPGPAQCGR